MEPIYVIGHKNPDTDSVVAAMAYASLHSSLGETDYVPARLGHLNDETTYLLQRFGFKEPDLIGTVRTQVRDIDFDRPPLLDASVPISSAWDILHQPEYKGISVLPVKDDDGRLFGMVTTGSIAESDMESIQHPVVENVPVFNLLAAIEGRIINSDEDVFDTISGEVTIALPSQDGNGRGIHKGAVVICGDQTDVVDEALAAGASCVILCESSIAEKYRGVSSETCIIAAPVDAYRAVRMIYQAIPVGRIAQTKDLVCFHLDDYLDDVREAVLQTRYRAYPVLDADDRVVGTLGRFHLIRPKRKRVVLVDHNERSQSVNGLDQAEIVAIIDHHRLADVQTGYPIYMRNEPVGSTVTIVSTMYQEHGLMPSPKLAGLMCAAIISDTVAFKSPTCTPVDRRIAERLARVAGLTLDELAKEVFHSASIAEKTPEELLGTDFKEFHIGGHAVGVAQVTSMDSESALDRLDRLLPAMEEMKAKNGYDMMILMLTDILREGSELVYAGDTEVIRNAFNTGDIHDNHLFLPHVMSRKKQIIPALSVLWG